MIPAVRLKRIVEIIETENAVTVSDLCSRLNVSEMTIRRDLRHLAKDNLLVRVHGGAIATRGRSFEPPRLMRAEVNAHLKRAIADQAALLVHEGDSIVLDVGTTTLELSRRLVDMPNLTIITNSLPLANILSESSSSCRIIVCGGVLRPGELSMGGHIAERTFKDFQVDKCFLGVGGVHADSGLTEYNLEDALVKQVIIKHAKQVIVLADNSKLNQTCFKSIAPLSEVDTIVTDEEASADEIEKIRARDVKIITAPVQNR